MEEFMTTPEITFTNYAGINGLIQRATAMGIP
jgi:hypothetical protein